MKLPTFRYWRTLVPTAVLAATVAIVARFGFPLPADAGLLLWYSRLDPLLLLSTLRWEGGFPVWGWLPLATVLVTLAFGRVFCGWLCPVGGFLALLESLKNTLRPSARGDGRLPAWTMRLFKYRYPWLTFLLALLLLGSGWVMVLSPFHLLTEELSRIWLRQIPWMLITLAVLGLFIFPRFWCVFLCPTGLLLSLLAKWRRAAVSPPESCVHCGGCEQICPTGAARPEPGIAGQDCLLCGRCSERCPVGSFEFAYGQKTGRTSDSGGLFTRREIIRSGVALTVAVAAMPVLSRPAGSNPLRPPGALEEDEFLARCSRCGRCIKVCPADCLQAMPITSGPAFFLTPTIIPRQARCELTQLCQQVCPTGAISQVPVEKALIGLAEIDHARCIGWSQGRLCLLCQEQCPLQAIDSDERYRPTVITDLCVGCGACENGCPLEEAAIVVRPQPTRRRS
ncbi:MAG: 4Fe-4S binding protein [Negativicutes bacterium]|nr:4Fe-4S binding protein [Negativicutes bacterium]